MVGGTLVTIVGENLGMDGYNISVYFNDVGCNKVTVVQPFKRYEVYNILLIHRTSKRNIYLFVTKKHNRSK